MKSSAVHVLSPLVCICASYIGYFPANSHEFCWPCGSSTSMNFIFLIGSFIFVFSLWGLMSFGIDSMSAAILLSYLQITNMIQVQLTFVCRPHWF